MSVAQMRGYLKDRYNRAPKWCRRVDNMSDEQVMAIYFRMIRTPAKH